MKTTVSLFLFIYVHNSDIISILCDLKYVPKNKRLLWCFLKNLKSVSKIISP